MIKNTVKIAILIAALAVVVSAQARVMGSANISGRASTGGDVEHVLLPLDLNDNGYNDAPIIAGGVTYYFSSPLARAIFVTSATQVLVNGYTTIAVNTAAASRVGIRVAGVDVATITPSADGTFTGTFSLSPGTKTIEVITGGQNLAGTVLGVFLRSVTVPGGATFTLTHPTAAPRLFIYGDSIAVGYLASTPALQAWPQLVRESYSSSLMLEAWGSRSLSDDASNGTLRAAFVAHLVTQTPEVFWLAIGSNDWSMTKWTAANFGTAYAALLDDLHAALPNAIIYAQSPIVRSGTTNGNGETLANFRTQISTAAAARPTFTIYIDGAAILTLGDLADGTHPTTAGHVIYANFFKTTLGL